VLATDPETGKTEAKPVIALIFGESDKHLVQITVDTDGKQGEETGLVVATEIHPFWVSELRKWVGAKDLKPGMWLRTAAGTYIQVTAIKKWTAHQRVHNLTVADIHTYHVAVGDANVLVHNAGPGPCDQAPFGPQLNYEPNPKHANGKLGSKLVQSPQMLRECLLGHLALTREGGLRTIRQPER
jgi:hypothetical protein